MYTLKKKSFFFLVVSWKSAGLLPTVKEKEKNVYRVTHKKSFDSAEPAQSATRVRFPFSGYVKKQKEGKSRTWS